jgi:hypothetical protein
MEMANAWRKRAEEAEAATGKPVEAPLPATPPIIEPPEGRNWKGVRWIDSIKAGNIAEEICNHFAKAIPELMASRSGIVSEEENDPLSDSAIQEITADLAEVLTGRESGCIDPEDLDDTNCSIMFVEDKLTELLDRQATEFAALEAQVNALREALTIAKQTVDEWTVDSTGRVYVHKDVIEKAINAGLYEAKR